MSILGIFKTLFRRGSAEPLTGLDPFRTRVIVGLGNPGPEYLDTRHNVGFRCVDLIATRFAARWQDKTAALDSLVAVTHPDQERALVLLKPQTFMNRSGKSVREVLDFLNIDPRNALVVYDEMDLPFGALRLRERGGPGTHNGMRSVLKELNTEDIARLRVGIGQSSPGEATSHVLGEFSAEQTFAVRQIVERAADAALEWAEHGAAVAMNRYNNT